LLATIRREEAALGGEAQAQLLQGRLAACRQTEEGLQRSKRELAERARGELGQRLLDLDAAHEQQLLLAIPPSAQQRRGGRVHEVDVVVKRVRRAIKASRQAA
jgi:hypothetical protein